MHSGGCALPAAGRFSGSVSRVGEPISSVAALSRLIAYWAMGTQNLVLSGRHIRLEPLDHGHVDGLATAASVDRTLYQWSPIPQGKAEAITYVDTALAWLDAGTALPFVTVRVEDGVVIGSTRFFNLERWAWPPGHARHGRQGSRRL